jgi:uncharacterized protein YqiB (DUF1249 family)
MKLIRLLPQMDVRDHFEFALPAARDEINKVEIRVIERSRYTSTISVIQHGVLSRWLPSPSMTVRIYHDARSAEVVCFERKRYFKAKYDYPNRQLFQRDEKSQLNRFLGEWLSHCLDQGLSLDKAYATNSEKCD